MRVNPFDVWNGDKVVKPFVSNYKPIVTGPGYTEQINAYAPWEYTFLMPFSFLEPHLAWGLYLLIIVGCLIWIHRAGYLWLREEKWTVDAAFIGTSIASLMIAYPAWSNNCIGNFSVIVLAAILGLAFSLENNHRILAGICWSIAMLKPQLGIAFAIPLLLRREWVTCFVAGSICAGATLVPAAICHTSPFKLIIQAPKANLFCFVGCGTWPTALCGIFSQSIEILLALGIGLLICLAINSRIKQTSWLLYLAPSAICATTWTYASTYGHVMNWFAAMVLLLVIGQKRLSFRRVLAFVLTAVVLMRITDATYGFYSGFHAFFPGVSYTEVLHNHLSSFNSLADIIIAMVLILKWHRLSPSVVSNKGQCK